MSYGTYTNGGSAWPDKPMDMESLRKAMQEASDRMSDLNIPDCFLMTTADYYVIKKAIAKYGVEAETMRLGDSLMFGIPFEHYTSPTEVYDRCEELRRQGKKVTVISSNKLLSQEGTNE